MSVIIIKQGLLDTIQDMGRFGYQHLGINPGGVMDPVSAKIANLLAGNQVGEAVIELHFPASTFLFQQDCLVALAGADFNATIDDQPIPINSVTAVSKNEALKFSRCINGAQCYMAVRGGWNIKPWLSSYTTNLKAVAGGFNGRALRKDDVIEMKDAAAKADNLHVNFSFAIKQELLEFNRNIRTIRCVPGNEYEWLSDEAKSKLQTNQFQISLQSDRMGYRLAGEKLSVIAHSQLLSSAVTRGAVQLLPSGQLIVLMADHQTTGGYPKIAHVISADFYKLAQMQPNQKIEFQVVDHEVAEEAFVQQQQYLQQLETEIN